MSKPMVACRAQRGFGDAPKLVECVLARGGNGHADTGCYRHVLAEDREGPPQLFCDRPGDPARIVFTGQQLQDHGEPAAFQPTGRVVGSNASAQAASGGYQDAVTRLLSERVANHPMAVQVHHQQPYKVASPLGPS